MALSSPDHTLGITLSKWSGITPLPTKVDCLEFMTPECLRQLYNIPPPDCDPTHPNSTLGIYTQPWSALLDADLDSFNAQFHPDLNVENNVDIQYATSIAFPHPVTIIQVGSRTQVGNTNLRLAAFDADYCASGGIEPAYDMLPPDPVHNPSNHADCGTVDPPEVITISYAWNEADFTPRYPAASAKSSSTSACAASPSSPPWATGASPTSCTSAETAMASRHPHLSTSSRFSNLFPRPLYESPSVPSYLSSHNMSHHLPSGIFNSAGRGYPEISLLAVDYLAPSNGGLPRASGTSVAAPVVAGMVARVNGGRVRRWKGTVGV
ncbi:peptidase S8/S53 domain-containing protein [Schizothecium vesticola]|uniref:Peptidase S8/S53 domain-containing protein n=1 Tax=Schizothecium vesticola TaxID=314040 RepID=A0AA40BP80_9PEZI|nr:peptidase S8/S53 domain-containing protein [Schizothecium vesticola]